jgi:hypothetical protein
VDITLVSDEELKRLVEQRGPLSAEASVIRQLSKDRAKDRQVFAWRVGEYYFTGPMPDAQTELAMLEQAEEE